MSFKDIPAEAWVVLGIGALAVWLYCRHVRIQSGNPSLLPSRNPSTAKVSYGTSTSFPVT